MEVVTFLWSMDAAIALVLGAVCAMMWVADRRDLAKLMFCVTAAATAAATPFELGMMQATTAFELGEQLRWYHLPIFFSLIGLLLFVRYYLGTGRLWLLWTTISLRVFILVVNFSVQPNFNFREIASLRHVVFFGERVSVVGESTPRPWQWMAVVSILLIIGFVADATIVAWRKGGIVLRRRALTVGLAIIVPMVGHIALNWMVVGGVLHVPICNTLWSLGTLAVIAYELARELIMNNRARLQLAELRREWAQVERVNALGQLASALVHEMAQPVSAARWNLEAASEHLRRKDPDLNELRSILEDLHKDNLRAAEIIDRTRSFISGRTVAAQEFRLDEVVNGVFSLLRHEAIARGVELKCNLPAGLPLASGDPVQISQVIVNLVINGMDAVQISSVGAKEVLLEARTDESARLEITVRDSGSGIPADKLEEVFKPLYTTKAAGLGVGLAFSRVIVDAHGGRLWAENADAGGAILRFTLPQGRAPTSANHQTAVAVARLSV